MIKLIASDLDGTLLPEGSQSLPLRTLELIRQLVEKGIYFVAASGREYENERFLFASLEDKISYIAANGTLCVHQGEVISRSVIPSDIVLRILKELKKTPDFEVFMSGDHCCYVEKRNAEFLASFADVLTVDAVESLFDVTVPIRKIAICNTSGNPQAVPAYLKHLQEVFHDEVRVVTSGNEWIDFLMPGSNKGTALRKLLTALDIRPEECMVFGDQQNDIEMLECGGISYAMATAAPGVADHADYVTDSPADVMEELLRKLD